MGELNRVKKKFEELKNNDTITRDKKSIELAKLMTDLEKYYNIPLIANKEFEELPIEVRELYLEISNAR